MTRTSKHPPKTQLALFAGEELGWMETWTVKRHLLGCAACRKQVAEFSQDRQIVQDLSAELPPGVDWDRLSSEMAGNIRVGLAAGEAIAAFDPPSEVKVLRRRPALFQAAFHWNAGWAIAAVSLVFAVGFWINLPRPQAEHLAAALRGIRFDRIGKVIQSDSANGAATAGDVLVEASRASIQVWENGGGSLSLLNPRSDGPTISVSTQGSAGARYIDSDTGQVTINQVYYAPQ